MADDATLLEGMRRACDLEQIVAVHAENEAITSRLARRAVAEGRLSAADYLASRPVIAELEAIQRAIFFAWESDCALHINSVSTARGIELVTPGQGAGTEHFLRDVRALSRAHRGGHRAAAIPGQDHAAVAHPLRPTGALGPTRRRRAWT